MTSVSAAGGFDLTKIPTALIKAELERRQIEKKNELVNKLADIIAPRIDVEYVINNPDIDNKVCNAIQDSQRKGEFKEFKDELDVSLYAQAIDELKAAICQKVFERVNK